MRFELSATSYRYAATDSHQTANLGTFSKWFVRADDKHISFKDLTGDPVKVEYFLDSEKDPVRLSATLGDRAVKTELLGVDERTVAGSSFSSHTRLADVARPSALRSGQIP